VKGLLSLLLLAAVAAPCAAATLWRDKSLYASGQELKVGDVVVIAVSDISKMSFSMNMNSKSSSNVSSNPDVNITGFLPKVNADKKSTTTDSSDLKSKSDLNIEIAAVVTARTPEGKYQVRGTKEYIFNGVSNRFEVSGLVDPALLNGRSVRSSDVVDFRLNVAGTKQGMGMAITREPLKDKEQPKAELTDAEKQRLIIDYLTKMLGELSR
jgi:flagellar basal body L-ring protein FlgH